MGFQAARHPTKLMKFGLRHAVLRGIAFSLRHVSHSSTLHVNVLYQSIPYDFHITGEGMCYQRSTGKVLVDDRSSALTVDFALPLTQPSTRSDANFICEIELTYVSDVSDNAYLLFDTCEPVFSGS
jgi:hypothetical protein